jgi:predicted nucleic acid-binding protein
VIYLSADVALHAAGREHPLKAPCLRIMEAAARRPDTFTTGAEAFLELLHAALRQGRPLAGRTPLASLQEIFGDGVLPLHGRDVLAATELRQELGPALRDRDLVCVALLQRHGIERIVSTDPALDGVTGLTRLDPARLAEWEDPDWFA